MISLLLEFKMEVNSSFCVLARLRPSTIKSLIKGLSGFLVYTRQSIFISGWDLVSNIYEFTIVVVSLFCSAPVISNFCDA